jgi:hypothetical protein
MADFSFYGNQWHGLTSAQQREHCVRWYLEPAARLIFAAIPEARSVILAVAQYWCDEANDATHLTLIVSPELDPKWPAVLETALFSGNTWERNAVSENLWILTGGGFGDSNYGNIVAFASQCRKDCHQEMSTAQAYRPWAIARRAEGNDCTTTIVGKTLQRAFEDNFNVGFNRIDGDEDDYTVSAGPKLSSYSKEFLASRVARGEAVAQLELVESELQQLVAALSVEDSTGELARVAARYQEQVVALEEAVARSEGVRR